MIVREIDSAIIQAPRSRRYPTVRGWPLIWPAGLLRRALQVQCLFPALWVLTRPDVRGRENLLRINGPVLFAANHNSHLDSLTVLRALPSSFRERTAVAAAEEYFFHNRFNAVVTQLVVNGFPFARCGSIRQSLEYCGGLVDRGWSLLVYPEGSRAHPGKISDFKSGVGLLGVKLGVPVVPIRIRGLESVLPKGRSIPRPHRVDVRIGEPMTFAPDIPYPEATRQVEEAVRGL